MGYNDEKVTGLKLAVFNGTDLHQVQDVKFAEFVLNDCQLFV